MKKIYVGNLSYKATQEELQSLFEPFGPVESVALIADRYTGESKGFAFVTFKSQAAAQEALSLDGTMQGGRNMKVSMARENQKDNKPRQPRRW